MGMNDEVILNSISKEEWALGYKDQPITITPFEGTFAESNTVTLSKEEYAELMEKSEKLDALMSHGVDNWDGYDDAMDELNTTDGE